MARRMARFVLWLASWLLGVGCPGRRRHWPLRGLQREIWLELSEGLRTACNCLQQVNAGVRRRPGTPSRDVPQRWQMIPSEAHSGRAVPRNAGAASFD